LSEEIPISISIEDFKAFSKERRKEQLPPLLVDTLDTIKQCWNSLGRRISHHFSASSSLAKGLSGNDQKMERHVC
jgi:uncharacterized membrane-anchored protein YhcB (DUF1043 family)